MDKVDDESQTTKGVVSFQNSDGGEAGLAGVRAKVSTTSLGVPLDQVEWDEHPPVVEMKVNTSYLHNKKISQRTTTVNKVLTVVIAITAVVLVWGAFLLPQLCYFKLGLCKESVSDEVNEVTDDNVSQIFNCSRLEYTGSICQPYFNVCTNSLINIDSGMESTIISLFLYLDNEQGVVSDSCRNSTDTLKTFVCQVAYQPCDSVDYVIQPARRTCEDLRDNICPTEWDFLKNTAFGDTLPSCGDLPLVALKPNCTNEIAVPTTPTQGQDDNTNDQCAQDYAGDVCSDYLTICPDNQINQYDQAEEDRIATAFSLLPVLASDTCRSAQDLVENFLCMYTFEPCDSHGGVHRANRSTCEMVTEDLCSTEVAVLGLEFDCQNLPEISATPTCNYSVVPSPSPVPPTSPSPHPSSDPVDAISLLQCNEKQGFFLYVGDNATINNTCQARCSKWIIYDNEHEALALDIALMVVVCLGMIGGFAMIFFSIVRYNKMFKFPNTFIFCLTLVLICLGLIVIIQYINPSALSCSSDDLVTTSLEHPTTFCTISGIVVMYGITGMAYWWFVHVCVTFYKVMFPFRARSYEKYDNYVQVVLILVGIVLPIIPGVLPLAFDGYILTRFPPLLCSPRKGALSYYALLLPISIIMAIGITFLIIILYVLKQKQRLFKHRDSRSYWLGLSTAEKKLLIVFFYYIILGVITILAYSITTTTLSSVMDAITENFQCELLRTDPSHDCPQQYASIRLAASFAITAYIILGFFTYFNLLYALNFGEIKAKLRKCLGYKGDSGQSTTKQNTKQSVIDAPDTPFTLRRRLTYTISQTSTHANINGTIGRSGTYIQKTTEV